MAAHVRAMLEMKRRGSHAFDYGNNLRAQALLSREPDLDEKEVKAQIPGFVPAYIRRSFARQGPVSAGRRCRATPTTSASPTTRYWPSFPTMATSTAGSPWRRRR